VTVAAVILVAAVAMLCVNLYVQSAGVQARIAQALANAFHVQVKLAGASFTPWGGLHLTGIEVPQPDPANPGLFLQTSEVSARIRWLPLLAHRLVIRQLSVNDPKVVWIQNSEGSWRLPEAPPAPPLPPPSAGMPASNAPAPGTQIVAAPIQASPAPGTPFTVSIGRFRLKRAAFDFLDSTGKPVASFYGITLDCPSPTDELVQGMVRSSGATIGGVVVLDGVRTNFTYAAGRLSLSDFEAGIAQGHVRGTFELQTTEFGSPFSVAAQFEDIQLQPLIPKTRNAVIEASGVLSGFLNAAGNAQDQKSITGTGQVVLRNGRVRYELFQMLGDLLQIPEFSQLDLSQAQLDYHLADAKVQVDQLLLQSPNLEVTARGNMAFADGRLDLAARLGIDRRVSDRLPSVIRENFASSGNSGLSYRDFNIHGTITSPKTDLVQRDIGRKIKRELTDMLLNVFGGRKKEQKAGPPPGTPARQIPGPFPTPPTSPFSSPMVPATAPPPSPLPSLAPLPSAGPSPSAAVGK